MTDGQLLERFMAARDEAGELAFESLVARHGPMVMRVCRNMLEDAHDAHDAFQAVFLVLARRGGAIRDRRCIASWLYGVAMRVAARARFTAIRREIRDRRTAEAAVLCAGTSVQGQDENTIATECAQVVHQELNRLPEKYRAPIVLCYLEGLTHDEAALRLSWPVGTVRSRLARARDTLRARLTRRGVTAPAAVGPMANWLAKRARRGVGIDRDRLRAVVRCDAARAFTFGGPGRLSPALGTLHGRGIGPLYFTVARSRRVDNDDHQ